MTDKIIILLASLLLLSVPDVLAQDFCQGDFNYDGAVAADDVTIFLSHFGRSQFNNPCPPDGPSPVPKTGQTSMNTLFDDGYYQKGVVWPAPRFTDNSDGTVTDNLTGLIWLKDANCISTNYPAFFPPSSNGRVPWYPALAFIVGINDGTYLLCGEGYNDWRLPNYRELFSLVDVQNIFPSIPSGNPFNNVQTGGYWSSTTGVHDPSVAWYVDMGFGKVDYDNKGSNYSFYVWPVRDGRECIEDETRPCGTDMGECEYGVETCTDGLWGGCVGGIPPTDEVCDDGLDNDCDGEIDEGCEMLIDTGQPTDSTYNWSLHNNPTSTVWLAGEFTLDQDYILNSIQFFVSHQVSGTVTMVIYEDNGEVPDISSELFSDTFYGQSGYDANWDGLTGLNWYLPQGIYWVAIEPRLPDEYYYGHVPSDAPFPLNNYAAYNGSNGFYVESDLLTFGLRIAGRLPTP